MRPNRRKLWCRVKVEDRSRREVGKSEERKVDTLIVPSKDTH